MAHDSSSKAHLLSELSRSRQSSPYDENVYMTATGTSFQDVLHSTPLRDSPQHASKTDQSPDPFEHDGNGSTDMSIEIGRGVKRFAQGDMSSEGIFTFGNDDSHYEVAATPPIPPRNGTRRTDGSLRKEASLRRATESARANNGLPKRATSISKSRAVSDVLPKASVERDNSNTARDFQPLVAPPAARNTRFLGSRQSSINGFAIPTRFVVGQGLDLDHTPQRTANLNATVQSTTFTANQSFMLPNIPDITELVSGVRKDGTPVSNRGSKSRSRFTSGSLKLQPHRVVESLPVPDEEKVIIASLQTLKDKISELEAENVEAQKRAEQFESEASELRRQFYTQNEQATSELGSDDETLPPGKPTKAANKLEASLKAVQNRFNHAERKAATAQISVQRVIKERDALVTQIAAAYFTNEGLLRENEEYRTNHAGLLTEISDLKNEIAALKIENDNLKARARKDHLARSTGEAGADASLPRAEKTRKVRDLAESSQAVFRGNKISAENISSRRHGANEADLASRIEREVQRYRDEAATQDQNTRPADGASARSTVLRPRSKSRPRTDIGHVRRGPSPQRTASAPPDLDINELDPTTKSDLPRKAKRIPDRHDALSDEDITTLSHLDGDMAAALRIRLQEEYRARRSQKQALIPTAPRGLHRKSSLKGPNDAVDEGTGRVSVHSGAGEDGTKTGKTVRVQSPHASDATLEPQSVEAETGDVSILSNTSRRRRRASGGTEGMTSAFIIPDITMHDRIPLTDAPCIPHAAAQCTACRPEDADVTIPTPVPVSSRGLAPPPSVAVPAGEEEETVNDDATLRPAQAPALALATVIKHLEDEITHLKLRREAQNRLYTRHDPAVSQRRRRLIRARLDALTAEIEKRSDQVYALYDVLEGQKQAAAVAAAATAAHETGDLGLKEGRAGTMGDEEVEETLMSVGIDPVELSGKLGRGVPVGLDGMDEWSEGDSEELPWEGLSEVGSSE